MGSLFVLLLFPSQNSIAQMSNSPDRINKHEIIMDLQATGMAEMPNMLILVFDSATCTYQFARSGKLTLLACNTATSGRSAIVTEKPLLPGTESMNGNVSRQQVDIAADSDNENIMELKEWMLEPAEWLR